jgi:hypothetical protein
MPKRLGMEAVPVASFFADPVHIIIGMKVEDVDKAAVEGGVTGVEFDATAEGCDGFVKLAGVFERVTDIDVSLSEVGLERDGMAIGGERVIELALVGEGDAEVAVGGGKIGFESEGLAIGGEGVVDLAFSSQ